MNLFCFDQIPGEVLHGEHVAGDRPVLSLHGANGLFRELHGMARRRALPFILQRHQHHYGERKGN